MNPFLPLCISSLILLILILQKLNYSISFFSSVFTRNEYANLRKPSSNGELTPSFCQKRKFLLKHHHYWMVQKLLAGCYSSRCFEILCPWPIQAPASSFQYLFVKFEWKTHCIVPILKFLDKSSVCNYRPISLLSVTSKVLERLIYDNIIDTILPKLSYS